MLAPRPQGTTADTVQYVGKEATPEFPCPGAYWGHLHYLSEGEVRTVYDSEKFPVDINDWGAPPPERLRRTARRWREYR